MKVKINEKQFEIRKVSNKEVKEIIATIAEGAVTTDEVKAVAENPAGIAENLEKFAEAICIATQRQITAEEIWDCAPDETVKLIEDIFELNNVANIIKSVGKITAQLKR